MVQGSTAVLKWKNTTFQFLHAQWVKIYISLIYIYIFIIVTYNAYAILRDATIMHRKQSLVILITQTYHCEFYDIGMDNFIYMYLNELICWYTWQYQGTISRIIDEFIIQILKIHVAFAQKIMPQACHNFAHATTAKLLWHVQNCDMMESLELK